MPLSFMSNGNTSGGAVPYQATVEPSQLGMFLNLEQAEMIRIQRYNESWRFYYGKHWSFQREGGEPLVTLNYFRKFVDKLAEFMVGKGFVVTTHEALEETSKQYLDEVWTYNNRDAFGWDIALMGGVTGDAFVLITDEEPTDIQQKINPMSQGKTRINLLSSEQVFPTWDPLNINTLTSVRIETIYYADKNKLDRSSKDTQGRQAYVKRFTQIITPNQILEQFHGEQPKIRANALGEIPLVHIKNLAVPKEYYGMGDGVDLVDLCRELNEKSTDISDTINYHSAPITVITGAKVKNLERGPRQIWSGLPEGAQVFNLKLEGDLPAAQSYWDKIKKAMHELGDVPEGILGQTQPISNTSGVALHIQYQPIIGRTKRKRVQYEMGFEQINYFILRIGMIKGRINLPFDICSHCGGRVLEMNSPGGETVPVWNEAADDYVDQPMRVKKCFSINKQNLEFVNPKEMRVKIWREYGFGGEVREVSMDDARAIAAGAQSYWDYAFVNTEEAAEHEAELERVRSENLRRQTEAALNPAKALPAPPKADGTPAEPPEEPTVASLPEPVAPTVKVRKLPLGEVSTPEEPVTVTVVTPLLHPKTGAAVRVITKEMSLVPTGCSRPAYLNPYESVVTFNDVLPKDEALQATLYQQYQASGWVDEEWVQTRIPEIAGDIQGINRRKKMKATSGMPQPAGAALQPAQPTVPAATDLSPAEQPIAAVPGPGGNPVEQGAA